jgi:uncharacterized membrane protein
MIKSSLSLLLNHPVLFVPKIIVAILYGIGILSTVFLAQKLLSLSSLQSNQLPLSDLNNWLILSIGLIVLTIFTYFLDLFFSGLYPFLINQALKGRINFLTGIKEAKQKLISLFLAGIILWALIIISSLLESILLVFLKFSWAGILVSVVLAFVFLFFFYFLFPIIVFKKQGALKSIKETFFVSLKNKRKVFFYSLIPFSVSLVKMVLAFFVSFEGMIIVFWVLVLLTGIIYAVHAVVNQLLYLKISSKKN